jgi:hypothetical protein
MSDLLVTQLAVKCEHCQFPTTVTLHKQFLLELAEKCAPYLSGSVATCGAPAEQSGEASAQRLKAEIRSLIAKYDSYRMNDAEKCPGWILHELRELSAV